MEDFEISFDIFEFYEKDAYNESFSLLIYDIIDNRRRQKFAKYMESFGKRVQKSAFEIRLDKRKLNDMITGIPKLISEEDSVKLYRIHGNGEVMCWGQAEFETKEDVIII